MLPILNTAKRNITLHTSADLSTSDIQLQKQLFDSVDKSRQKKASQENHLKVLAQPSVATERLVDSPDRRK